MEEDNIYEITALQAEVDEISKIVADLTKTIEEMSKKMDGFIKEKEEGRNGRDR